MSLYSCCKSPLNDVGSVDSVTMQSNTISVVDSIIDDSTDPADDLSAFKCVLDTLNSAGDRLVHSEYFLFDITDNGNPELWIKTGSCEANMQLLVFSTENDSVRELLSDNGGHTDFFLNDNTLGSVTCHAGSGYVSSYRYHKGKLKVQKVEFSMLNDEGEPRAIKKKEQPLIKIWENSDIDIPLKAIE